MELGTVENCAFWYFVRTENFFNLKEKNLTFKRMQFSHIFLSTLLLEFIDYTKMKSKVWTFDPVILQDRLQEMLE